MPNKWIVAFLAAPLLWGPAAFAEEGNPGEGGHHWHNRAEWHQPHCTDRYAHKVGHLAYLEAKLALTETQRPAWNKWRQAQLDAADQRKAACLQHQPKEGEKPTVIEREACAEKWLSARLAQLQASRPALQALYDALTPEQKAIFDRAAHYHRHHGWHHGGGQHQGWHHCGHGGEPEQQ